MVARSTRVAPRAPRARPRRASAAAAKAPAAVLGTDAAAAAAAKPPSAIEDAEGKVVSHVQSLIESGKLRPGSRLPGERDLATTLGVSRPSIRAGLGALQAMGVVRSRHGSGTFVTDGPPSLDARQLHLLASLHRVGVAEVYEARRALEVEAAGLAAARATGEQLAAIEQEVAGVMSCLDDVEAFVARDAGFHRAVAAATGNTILAALVGMMQTMLWDMMSRRARPGRHLREAAEFHRRIYDAIRDRDVKRARTEMERHLEQGQRAQEAAKPPEQAPAVAAATPSRHRRRGIT
jgi:GntR family transcriptional regulator, transcriptional repressor for pyruvate dehydrogenase complex